MKVLVLIWIAFSASTSFGQKYAEEVRAESSDVIPLITSESFGKAIVKKNYVVNGKQAFRIEECWVHKRIVTDTCNPLGPAFFLDVTFSSTALQDAVERRNVDRNAFSELQSAAVGGLALGGGLMAILGEISRTHVESKVDKWITRGIAAWLIGMGIKFTHDKYNAYLRAVSVETFLKNQRHIEKEKLVEMASEGYEFLREIFIDAVKDAEKQLIVLS